MRSLIVCAFLSVALVLGCSGDDPVKNAPFAELPGASFGQFGGTLSGPQWSDPTLNDPSFDQFGEFHNAVLAAFETQIPLPLTTAPTVPEVWDAMKYAFDIAVPQFYGIDNPLTQADLREAASLRMGGRRHGLVSADGTMTPAQVRAQVDLNVSLGTMSETAADEVYAIAEQINDLEAFGPAMASLQSNASSMTEDAQQVLSVLEASRQYWAGTPEATQIPLNICEDCTPEEIFALKVVMADGFGGLFGIMIGGAWGSVVMQVISSSIAIIGDPGAPCGSDCFNDEWYEQPYMM